MLSHQKRLLNGRQRICLQILAHRRAVFVACVGKGVKRQGILLPEHGTHGLIIIDHRRLLIAQHKVCLSKIYFFVIDHQSCLGSVYHRAVPSASGKSGHSYRGGKKTADNFCTCSFHFVSLPPVPLFCGVFSFFHVPGMISNQLYLFFSGRATFFTNSSIYLDETGCPGCVRTAGRPVSGSGGVGAQVLSLSGWAARARRDSATCFVRSR